VGGRPSPGRRRARVGDHARGDRARVRRGGGRRPPRSGSAGTPVGWALVIVAAAICEAIGSVLTERVRLPADAVAAAALQMLAAGVATVATALALGEGADVEVAELSAASLVAFAYLVGPGSILGYTAFVWFLQNAPVSTATTYAYVNRVVAVFLGWLVLSESVTVTIAVGGGVIVAAVVLIVRQEARPANQAQPSGAA
jgi:drug/metabolite transporter (DMT)-like permease